MYCPTCGAECQPGLNFCNRCGAAVNVALSAQAPVSIDLRSPVRTIGITVCLTTLIGLTILFVGLVGLAESHIDEGVVAGIGITGLLFLFGVELALIRLMSRLLVAAPEKRKLSLPFTKQAETKEFYAPPQYQPTLPEGRPSVTEHTTRTFTPVYREPRS